MPYKLPIRLNQSTALNLLSSVDNFLFDCDGVIWNLPNSIPGSVECINKLKSIGKRCFFVTNNSTKTRGTVLSLLQKVGVENVSENEIVCTAWVHARYLKSLEFKDKVYVIGSPAMGAELDNLEIKHTGIGHNYEQFPDPANYDYKKLLQLDPEVKCVSVGFDFYFNYPKIVLATSYAFKVPDCLFICTNDDAVLPTGSNTNAVIPGTGSIVNSLRTSISHKEPVMLGKPSRTMWEVLADSHGLDASRSCMVGDRLDTDIAFAANCSLGYSLAVLSGVTNEKEILEYSLKLDLENGNHEIEAKLCPDFYVDCLGDFHSLFQS